MATLTPRTASPAPSTTSSFVDDASTRAIFDGTPGKKPRIEILENLTAGLQPDFAEQYPSETSSTRAIYHGSRPPIQQTSSASSSNSPLPRLAALRGRPSHDPRGEWGRVVNSNPIPPINIEEWQNATAEDSRSTVSDESWNAKEDLTSVTESTLPEEMEEQIEKGQETQEELRRRRLSLVQTTSPTE